MLDNFAQRDVMDQSPPFSGPLGLSRTQAAKSAPFPFRTILTGQCHEIDIVLDGHLLAMFNL